MSGKRVLVVQTQAENAGAQEVSRLLGAELSTRGHEVRHLFFYRKTDAFLEPPGTKILSEKRPANPLTFIKMLAALYREFREFKPDCVLCFQHFGNVIAAPIARLASVRTIIANQVTAVSLLGKPLLKADEWWGRLGIYDLVATNSDALHAHYAAYPRRYVQRLRQVPHGFEDKSVPLSKKAAREALALPEDVPLLGCTARLNPAKQLELVIDLLAEHPSWHFAIAGQGPDRTRLEARAAQQDCTGRVHFLGEFPPDRIGVFLAALDVFAFPSAAETFGMAAVEAAQSGIPIVANRLPVLIEVLETENGPCADFVDVTDRHAFSAAIDRLLTDPRHAAEMVERGRLLKERYSLTKMADSYERLLDGRASGDGQHEAIHG